MSKASELREQTTENLQSLLASTQESLFKLRIQSSTERLEAPSETIKVKREIARILTEEGFIDGFETQQEGVQETLTLRLKYAEGRTPVVSGIKRISKPGLRVYARKTEIPRVLGGLGLAILSTSHGIMTGSDARKQNLGGEVLCYVW
jgi:small subunit ribosomal protein S8